MKKIFLVTQEKDALGAVESLRALGILHVEHINKPKGGKVDELREQKNRFEKVINILSSDKSAMEQQKALDPHDKCEEIWCIIANKEELQDSVTALDMEIKRLTPWGNFDPADIKLLKTKGIIVNLAEVPQEELQKNLEGVILEPFAFDKKTARCVVITREEKELAFKTVPLPARGRLELKKLRQEKEADIELLTKQIKEAGVFLQSLKDMLKVLEAELSFYEVYEGRDEKEKVALLKGFCPDYLCGKFEDYAKKENWAYILTEPDEGDRVPTLLKNPRWVELINPVFGFIKTLPGYQEQDVSLVFLVFFSVFFGMLIGDAGYGLVFMLGTAFAHMKFNRKIKNKTPFYLMYILSGMTILWGVLSGTYFGHNAMPSCVKPLLPWLGDNNNVMSLCFFIGALQLSVAHTWRGALKYPSLTCLSEAGWVSILWGVFFLARTLVVEAAFPPYARWFFILGAVLVVFFTKPNRNPLKALGPGVGAILMSGVNSFSDSISYIRLFAVGLATVAVADAFNSLALGVGFNNAVAGFFASLILVFGHALNIVLGAMSILVHGLRLNLLEFGTHMNMEWSGVKYSPFKKNINL